MKLISRPFEKSARRLARQRLRGSAGEWREYRRIHRWWDINASPAATAGFLRLLLGAAGISSLHSTESETVCFVLASLYATLIAFWRAGRLHEQLYHSVDLQVLGHLPLSDRNFLEIQWKRFQRLSLWSLFDFAVFFGLMGWRLRFDFSAWLLAVITIVIISFMIVALGMLLIARFAHWNHSLIAMGIGLVLGALWYAGVRYESQVPEAVWLFLIALPPGWILGAFWGAMVKGCWLAWLGSIPAIILVMTLPVSLRRLREQYVIEEIPLPFWNQEKEPAVGTDQPPIADRSGGVDPVLLRNEMRNSPDWRREGFISGLIAKCLGKRQKNVAELMAGGGPAWTAGWKLALNLTLVGGLILAVFPAKWATVAACVYCALLIMATMPFLGGRWPGFDLGWGWNIGMPVYALLPVRYSEISRTILKANALHGLMGFPLIMTGGFIIGWKLGIDLGAAALMACKVFILLLLVQPAMMAMQFSQGTNDTRRLRIAFWLAPIGIGFAIAFLMGGVALLFAPHGPAGVGAIVCCLASFGFWKIYGWFYDRGRFDLLADPKANEI